jgi:hypothetical protein
MLQTFCLLLSLLLPAFISCWKCNYYLKHHKEIGLAVYSSIIANSFDVFDIGIGLPVPLPILYDKTINPLENDLINYVEELNSTHALLTLGLGMLLNHHPNPTKVNIRKYLNNEEELDGDAGSESIEASKCLFHFPSTQEPSIDIRYEYSAGISPGDQLFIHYGEEWFQERSISMNGMMKYLTDQPEEGNEEENSSISSSLVLSGCVQHFATLQKVGTLVARRNITEGTVIETSRVIYLPATETLLNYHGPLSDVIWWTNELSSSVTTEKEVSLAGEISSSTNNFRGGILLSGYGPFYGAVNEQQTTSGNIRIEWERAPAEERVEKKKPSLVRFVVSKAVNKGEELVVSNLLEVTVVKSNKMFKRKKLMS